MKIIMRMVTPEADRGFLSRVMQSYGLVSAGTMTFEASPDVLEALAADAWDSG